MEESSGSRVATEFGRLNEEFYSVSPRTYFEQRLANLLVVAAQDPALGEVLRKGLDIGPCKVSVDDDEHIRSSLSADERRNFVTVESVVLLHHAAETLWRMFFAHQWHEPCPWVALTQMTSFSIFKSKVGDHIEVDFAKGLRPEYGKVLLGYCERMPTSSMSDDEWEANLTSLIGFMSHFGKVLLDDAHLYNATKHGFAVHPTDAYITFVDEDGTGRFGSAGPAVGFLNFKATADEEFNEWHHNTTWVNVVECLAFITAAIEMMGNVWNVGRVRHLNQPGEVRMFLPGEDGPATVRADAFAGGGINKWSHALFLELRPDHEVVPPLS